MDRFEDGGHPITSGGSLKHLEMFIRMAVQL